MSLERRINSVYIKSGLWLRPMRKKAETPRNPMSANPSDVAAFTAARNSPAYGAAQNNLNPFTQRGSMPTRVPSRKANETYAGAPPTQAPREPYWTGVGRRANMLYGAANRLTRDTFGDNLVNGVRNCASNMYGYARSPETIIPTALVAAKDYQNRVRDFRDNSREAVNNPREFMNRIRSRHNDLMYASQAAREMPRTLNYVYDPETQDTVYSRGYGDSLMPKPEMVGEINPLMWGIGVGGLAGAKGTIQGVGKAMSTVNNYRKAKAEAEAVRDALPALVTQAEKSLAAAEKAYRTSQTEMTVAELTRARNAFNALQEKTLAAAEAAGRASVLPSGWENAMNYTAGGASGGMRNGLIWGSGAAGAAQLYNWANPKPEYVEQWDTSGDPDSF